MIFGMDSAIVIQNFTIGVLILLGGLLISAFIVFYKRFIKRQKGEDELIEEPDDDALMTYYDADIDAVFAEFQEAIEAAGYAYDEEQNVFYSVKDAWQREMGYCRLYDEAAAPLGMIIDCEPIYFEYDNRRWLIEFWKGQYDLTTGCEIGIYYTDHEDVHTDIFTGPIYRAVTDDEMIYMQYNLYKKDKLLFHRSGVHWWLTGFLLGEFSEPEELTMEIGITLLNYEMLRAFILGLRKAGYKEDEIRVKNKTIYLKYDVPKSTQPLSRNAAGDFIIQRKNELMCKLYMDITGEYVRLPEKIRRLKISAPELYELLLDFGKSKRLFEGYKKIKDYLEL